MTRTCRPLCRTHGAGIFLEGITMANSAKDTNSIVLNRRASQRPDDLFPLFGTLRLSISACTRATESTVSNAWRSHVRDDCDKLSHVGRNPFRHCIPSIRKTRMANPLANGTLSSFFLTTGRILRFPILDTSANVPFPCLWTVGDETQVSVQLGLAP